MSVKITYYVHGTTTFNEQGIASGQSDIGLSTQGIMDAEKLRDLTKNLKFDAVFTSDLPRALETTNIAFGVRYPLFVDARLREINDGIYTGKPISEIPKPHLKFLDENYPAGESFKDVQVRVLNLLNEIRQTRDGEHLAFMSHFAPQIALEVILNGKTWEEAFQDDWRKTKAWQAGWEYILE